MKRMKIPGWGQCASVRGGHGDVPAHSSPSRARWLGMRLLVLMLTMFVGSGAWAETLFEWTVKDNETSSSIGTATFNGYSISFSNFAKNTEGNYSDVDDERFYKFTNDNAKVTINGNFKAGDQLVLRSIRTSNSTVGFKFNGNSVTDSYKENVAKDFVYELTADAFSLEIQRINSNAPFISKISLVRPSLSLGATPDRVCYWDGTKLGTTEGTEVSTTGQTTGSTLLGVIADANHTIKVVKIDNTIMYSFVNVNGLDGKSAHLAFNAGSAGTVYVKAVKSTTTGDMNQVNINTQPEWVLTDGSNTNQAIPNDGIVSKHIDAAGYVYVAATPGAAIYGLLWVPDAKVEMTVAGGYDKSAMPKNIPADVIKFRVTPNLKLTGNKAITLNGVTYSGDDIEESAVSDINYITIKRAISGLSLNTSYDIKLGDGTTLQSDNYAFNGFSSAIKPTVNAGTTLGSITTTSTEELVPINSDKVWTGNLNFTNGDYDALQYNNDNTLRLKAAPQSSDPNNNNRNWIAKVSNDGVYWQFSGNSTGLEFKVQQYGTIKVVSSNASSFTISANGEPLKTTTTSVSGGTEVTAEYKGTTPATIYLYQSGNAYTITRLEYIKGANPAITNADVTRTLVVGANLIGGNTVQLTTTPGSNQPGMSVGWWQGDGDNSDVASVNGETGLVTAHKTGNAKVNAAITLNGTEYYSTTNIKVVDCMWPAGGYKLTNFGNAGQDYKGFTVVGTDDAKVLVEYKNDSQERYATVTNEGLKWTGPNQQGVYFKIPKKGYVRFHLSRAAAENVYVSINGSEAYKGKFDAGDNILTQAWTGNGPAEVRLYFASHVVTLKAIEYIPLPEDMKDISDYGNTSGTWDENTGWNNATSFSEPTSAYYKTLHALVNTNNGISIEKNNNPKGYKFNTASDGSWNYLVFPAHGPGKVTVYAKGTGSAASIVEIGEDWDVTTGAENNGLYISGSKFKGYDDTYKLRVVVDEAGDNASVKLMENWSHDLIQERTYISAGTIEFTLTADQVALIKQQDLYITGNNIKFKRVYLYKEGVNTENQISLSAGGSPRNQWADVAQTSDQYGDPHSLYFFNSNNYRFVFIGATAGTVITKIEWEEGAITASSEDLQVVTERTLWYGGNNFGGFAYPPSTDTAIPNDIINPGTKDVGTRTLLIYGEKNKQNNEEEWSQESNCDWNWQGYFTHTGNLSLTRSVGVMKKDPNDPDKITGYDRLVEFKVAGKGLVRVVVAANGPGTRTLYVSNKRGTKQQMMAGSIMTATAEHDMAFALHQHSSYHELFGEVKDDGEQSIYLVNDGGVSIKEIEWIPGATIPTLCPAGCLSINEGDVIIGYDGDPNNGQYTYHVTLSNTDDVAANQKIPVWTSSQDGRDGSADYDGIINSIHDQRGYEKTITATGNKGGIVYVVAGTYEGNRNATRRVEVAGPAQAIELDQPEKIKLQKGTFTEIVAEPITRAKDVNRNGELVKIKVKDPNITWSLNNNNVIAGTGLWNGSSSSFATPNDGNSFAVDARITKESITVYGAQVGTTIVTATTATGKSKTVEIEVVDERYITLTRKNPDGTVDFPQDVSIYQTLKFEVSGPSDLVNANTSLPLDLYVPGKGTVRVQSTIRQEGNVWYAYYDVVSALRKQSGNTVHHMDYGQVQDVTFPLPTSDDHPTNTDPLYYNSFLRFTEETNENVTTKKCIHNFKFKTEENPSGIKELTFIYNVWQRADASLDADITAGYLLSENAADVESFDNNGNATTTHVIEGNKVSYIQIENLAKETEFATLDGSQIVANQYFKTNANAKITISPFDTNFDNYSYPSGKQPREQSIKSIELNFASNSAAGTVTFTNGEPQKVHNYTTNEDVDNPKYGKDTSEPMPIDLAHDYTAVWKPKTVGTRRAEISFSAAGMKLDQIKITYYVTIEDETENTLMFADKTEAGFPADLKTGMMVGDKVKLSFKETQQDTRFFNLVENFDRYTASDAPTPLLIGTSKGDDTGDKQQNIMVIRDDKQEPCEMYFTAENNTALIASIEFVCEDDSKNDHTPRNLFCISDPRYNDDPDQTRLTGYPFALEDEPDAADGTQMYRLVYRPESPVSFAAVAMDAEQPGYLFVRKIIVRYDNKAVNDEYKLITPNAGKTVDVMQTPLLTSGLQVTLPTNHEAETFLLKRTSLRNNLSVEIPLTISSTSGTTFTLNRYGKDHTTNTSNYRHQKCYTLRVLNERRMVIRQMSFCTEAISKPSIYYKDSSLGETPSNNTETRQYGNPMLSETNPQFVIRTDNNETDLGQHPAENKVIVYTTNGKDPSVTFSGDGRQVLGVGTGCQIGVGTGVTINANLNNNNNNPYIAIRALVLPLYGNAASVANYDDVDDQIATINEIGSYGEISNIERAYYVYEPTNSFTTTATRRDENDKYAALGYSLDEFPYATDVPEEYDMPTPDQFHGAYTPTTGVPANLSMTYGGYERWGGEYTTNTGAFGHDFVSNEMWRVKANELMPWRGIFECVAGDTYTMSDLEPLNEAAKYDGSDTKAISFDLNNKKDDMWVGEFNNTTFSNYSPKEFYKRTWELPCFGDYFVYEPKQKGTLTVYVKQQGVLDQDNNVLDDAMVWLRPVFIYDEAGNTPAGITASTTSKVGGDWMTTNHTNIKANKYLTQAQATNLAEMCWQWINDNASEYDARTGLTQVRYGNRANGTQGVMALYGSQANAVAATGGTYGTDMESYRSSLLGGRTNGNANGFAIVSEGYVKYEIPVNAGKSYFMFASRGNLGFCSYAFNPTETTNDVIANEYLDPTEADADVVARYDQKKDKKVTNFTLKRTFTADKWTSLVLPFSVSKKQLREVLGDGVEVIHFNKMEYKHLYLYKHVHQMVVAGVPVFIKPTKTYKGRGKGVNGADDYPVFHNVTIENNGGDDMVGMQVDNGTDLNYICKGYYGKAPIVKWSWYIAADGTFSRWTQSATPDFPGSQVRIEPASGVDGQKVQIVSVGYRRLMEDTESGEATGIIRISDDNAIVDGGNMSYDNNVYSVNGILIRQNTTDLRGLPAGVYIVNGEKHIVK